MFRFSAMLAIGCTLSVLAGFANADTINFQFNSKLTTGPLADTTFVGTASYDNHGETGKGLEYFSLTTFDFTLLGASFTKANIYQGGQAILKDGALFSFTAAIAPPPPTTSISTIAFGFGGPDVIGYSLTGPNKFGMGSFTLESVGSVPEPAALNITLLGLAAVAAGSFRLRKAKGSRLNQ